MNQRSQRHLKLKKRASLEKNYDPKLKMKLLFALFLLTLQLQLFLVTGTSYPAGEKVVKYSQNEDQIEKRAAPKDLLSKLSCKYVKKNGYCQTLIKRTLCKNTCRCRNKLSLKSCKTVKARVNCKTPWSITFCRYTCTQCSRTSCSTTFPLGMKSRAIPDSSITASSMWGSITAPSRARLDMKKVGPKCGWSTRYNSVRQWLQVDLGEVTKITDIATQGRVSPTYDQWVKTYSLQYSRTGRRFANYKKGKVFKGNSDQNTVVKHALNPPIIARFIRVRPKSWRMHISMRMELYGCI